MNRPILLLCCVGAGLALAACGYTPENLGITGPGTNATPIASHASEADEDAIIPDPGLPAGYGNQYAPSNPSDEGTGKRFFGYN